jgi:hypothetical protein
MLSTHTTKCRGIARRVEAWAVLCGALVLYVLSRATTTEYSLLNTWVLECFHNLLP